MLINNLMKNLFKILFLVSFLIIHATLFAQSKKKKKVIKKAVTEKSNSIKKNTTSTYDKVNFDSTKPNLLTITSTFKPFLKGASKINFTAATPSLDTNRISLAYNIPAQNLFFTYQPVPIKPIAYNSGLNRDWENASYIKLGFGNYTKPYVETALSFGDAKTTLFNVFANYRNSKGSVLYQENTAAQLQVSAAVNTIANHDFVATFNYQLSNQNKYGTNPNFVFTKDQLSQNFNTINANFVLHSKNANEFGIKYHPTLNTSFFSDNHQATETSILFDAPVEKKISKNISVDLRLLADISSYKINSTSISNNIFVIAPRINYQDDDLTISAGIQPTWNNSEVEMLPNISAEYKLAKEKFSLLAGLKSYYQKNTYKSLVSQNPFIDQPLSFNNTKTAEIFGGIKGAVGKHFSFNGKLSFLNYTNFVLFANDTATSKSQNFNVLNEPNLKAIKIGGEISYTNQEKFNFVTSVSFTQFTSQEKYDKVFGYLPLEITSSLRYMLLKDVYLKSELFIWDGANYRVKNNITGKAKMAIDFNLGTEVKVLKNTYFYLEFNNLFNNVYQRWNQYDVFGFNVVAGVVYSLH